MGKSLHPCDQFMRMKKYDYSKMYILVKESLPSHKAVSVAHAAVACYGKYAHEPETKDWFEDSFRKVVCEVTDEEFEEAKKYPNAVVMTENFFEDNRETAIAFPPSKIWPNKFRRFKLAPY